MKPNNAERVKSEIDNRYMEFDVKIHK